MNIFIVLNVCNIFKNTIYNEFSKIKLKKNTLKVKRLRIIYIFLKVTVGISSINSFKVMFRNVDLLFSSVFKIYFARFFSKLIMLSTSWSKFRLVDFITFNKSIIKLLYDRIIRSSS